MSFEFFKRFLNFFMREEAVFASVGDVCTQKLLRKGIRPKICIVDGHSGKTSYPIPKPHGYDYVRIDYWFYTPEIVAKLKEICESPKKFIVFAYPEEDELIHGIIAYAPINAVIFNGKEKIVVTEANKKQAKTRIEPVLW
jgi:uncharacterized protein (UPF0218 family)